MNPLNQPPTGGISPVPAGGMPLPAANAVPATAPTGNDGPDAERKIPPAPTPPAEATWDYAVPCKPIGTSASGAGATQAPPQAYVPPPSDLPPPAPYVEPPLPYVPPIVTAQLGPVEQTNTSAKSMAPEPPVNLDPLGAAESELALSRTAQHEFTRGMLVGPRSLDNFGRLILRCAAYDRRFFELARQIVNCDAMGKRTLADFLEFNMSMVFSLMQEFADAASPGTPRPGNPAEWLIAIRPHLLKLLREQPEMPRFYESVCKEILEGLPPLVFGELDWACDGLVDYIRGVRIHQVTFNATSEDPATRMAKLTAIEPSIRLPGSEKRWQGLKTLGEFEPTPFLIENLLVEGTVSMIFGPPGDGKTFLALDIGSSIASGRPWNGLRTERGGVLYFCLEAGAGFRNRMRALKSKSLLADDDPFGFTTEKLDLRSPDTQVRILNDIKANEAVFKTKVKLIVIDTLAVATSGGNECTSEDMGAALAAVGEVVKSSGVTVLLLHHPGKDVSRGPRGWSGIVGNLDTIIEMERCSNGLRRAKVTKQKDGEEGQTFTFELAVVTLRGKDQQSGTTCVVRHLTDEEAQAADGVDDPENLIRRLWAGRSHDEIITTATVREVLAMKQKGGSASTRATETMEALAKGGYVKETSRGPHNARQWLLTANGKELFHQASRPDTGSGES